MNLNRLAAVTLFFCWDFAILMPGLTVQNMYPMPCFAARGTTLDDGFYVKKSKRPGLLFSQQYIIICVAPIHVKIPLMKLFKLSRCELF